jgi:hypothetical protein
MPAPSRRFFKGIDWKFVGGTIGLFVNVAILGAFFWKSEEARRVVGTLAIETVFVVAVVICGSLLYWLRQRERGLYASLEILFGILAGVYAIHQILHAPDTDALGKAVFATVGGIYIIVRGLDNLFSTHRAAIDGAVQSPSER